MIRLYLVTCLIYICSFTVLFAGESNSLVSEQKNVNPMTYRLEKDTGWAVCQDMIKSLNNLQTSRFSFNCKIQFDPNMKQFSHPEWEDLEIDDYWQEIYDIESNVRRSIKLPSFERWKRQYIIDMRNGYTTLEGYQKKEIRYIFKPRLRKTQVRFEQSGQLETVLAYTSQHNASELCMEDNVNCPIHEEFSLEAIVERRKCMNQLAIQRGGQREAIGDHLVIYEQDTKKIRYLVPRDGQAPVSSSNSLSLFIFNNRGYMLTFYGNAISLIHVKRKVFENKAILPRDEAQAICIIPEIESVRNH